jgi:hypothetical protein
VVTRDPHELQGQLAYLAGRLGVDELRVLVRIAERLEMGAKQYGALSIANFGRDPVEEGLQEFLDGSVYMSVALLAFKMLRDQQ